MLHLEAAVALCSELGAASECVEVQGLAVLMVDYAANSPLQEHQFFDFFDSLMSAFRFWWLAVLMVDHAVTPPLQQHFACASLSFAI